MSTTSQASVSSPPSTMSPDPEVVARACMADLGRLRQEELPLSDRTKHGPSFVPSRFNDANRYGKNIKRELNRQWSVAIDDEEARQMDGLEIEDARPWDRRPGMEKKKQDIYAAKSEPPKLSDKAPATQHEPKQTTTPTAPADKTDNPETTVQVSNSTTQATSPFSKVVLQTVCRVAITFPEVVPPFTAEVTATIHNDTNSADIVIRDQAIKKSLFLVLDFRDLEEPILTSASICKLTCKSNKANSVILLSSDNPNTIQSLFTVLLKLHRIVSTFNAHSMFSSSIRKQQDFQTQPASIPTSSTASRAVKAAPKQARAPEESKASSVPSAECSATPLGDLLNLDDTPTCPSAPSLTLDAAIDAVGKLYTSILSDYSIVSIKKPLDRKDLRLEALDRWLAKGVICDETHDVADDLICILEATIRLKAKISPAATAELKPQCFTNTATERASNGIKYSLDDLRGLRIPYTEPKDTSQSPTLAATTETNEPLADTQCPKMAELEIGFGQLHIDRSGKEPLRKPANQKQQSKGLASSQWA